MCDIQNIGYNNDSVNNSSLISHYDQSFDVPINPNSWAIVILEDVENAQYHLLHLWIKLFKLSYVECCRQTKSSLSNCF
jgi:hypothetical protein